MKIRKAVLPVAGMGTRFFPATKVVPKELLPVGNKPVIQWLVEEAVASGIEEIIFVISPDKTLIREHFSSQPELEARLLARGKLECLKILQPLHTLARLTYVIQEEPRGDGDAILKAEQAVGKEPFLILFGDDLVKSKVPAARQLVDAFHGEGVLAVERVAREHLENYGVIDPGRTLGRQMEVKHLIEKPAPGQAPSDFGIIGKYVVTSAIFDALRSSKPGRDGELRLIDGFAKLLQSRERLWAYEIEGERFDTGTPEGLLKATQAFFEIS
ncbi:MAG: UTP--glucose-1-phosphate uridylyltransferase [Candidatus Peregrinibacteria bacterium]